MATLFDIVDYVNRTLEASAIKDYCPNGLQVEGRRDVNRIVSGVTASRAFLDAAIEASADAVVVHHGIFWRGDSPCVTGMLGQRVRRLIKADVSLMAWHLPLDVHHEFGNNAQLGKRLGLSDCRSITADDIDNLLWCGELDNALDSQTLAGKLETLLGRRPTIVGDNGRVIRRLGWCSGGAQNYLPNMALLDCDAYFSGEISEKTMHEARELGITYFHAGHHATERFGVQALGEHLRETFGLSHEFIDIDNPA